MAFFYENKQNIGPIDKETKLWYNNRENKKWHRRVQ